MIDRPHLVILQALDSHGTLSEAAQKLCLTQSALSHSIRKLETMLGTRLWRREGRTLRLTQAGRYLLRVSQRVLPQLEQAERVLKGFAEGKRGTLRIGMECHPCYEWLLIIVKHYLKRWPDVDLDVIQRFRFNGLDALRNHQIDILITPDPVLDDSLRYEPVLEYKLLLVVARTHPLAAKKYVTPEHLQNEHLLTYPVPRERLDVFTQFLNPASIQPKGEQQLEATEILLQLTAAGRGVCVLPDWMVKKHQELLPITGVHLGRKGIVKNLYVALRQGDRHIDYLQGFVVMSRNSQVATVS